MVELTYKIQAAQASARQHIAAGATKEHELNRAIIVLHAGASPRISSVASSSSRAMENINNPINTSKIRKYTSSSYLVGLRVLEPMIEKKAWYSDQVGKQLAVRSGETFNGPAVDEKLRLFG